MTTILSELVSLKFLIAYAWFGCVLYVHFRGKVKLRFERQLTEHSGIFSPLNTLLYLTSKVPKDPILDARDFPELTPLRENWETIRDEAVALCERGKIDYNTEQQDLAFVSFKKLGWKRFYMKWYSDFMPSAIEGCPKTVELLRAIPSVNAAAFTMLPPGSKLGRHRDPFAASMRYHLGLVTPKSDKCRIWIDGEEYVWRDGEDIVFDETYVHWAENESDENRIILFVDFTRPVYTPIVRAINAIMIKWVFRITRSQNEQDEKPGLLNNLTPIFFRLKHFFRAIKRRSNRKLYYAVKYTLVVGLLVWVLYLRNGVG